MDRIHGGTAAPAKGRVRSLAWNSVASASSETAEGIRRPVEERAGRHADDETGRQACQARAHGVIWCRDEASRQACGDHHAREVNCAVRSPDPSDDEEQGGKGKQGTGDWKGWMQPS
jgi:hypothetical protein